MGYVYILPVFLNKHLLQILLNNDCKLKELIDSLSAVSTSGDQCAIVLDLSCLGLNSRTAILAALSRF